MEEIIIRTIQNDGTTQSREVNSINSWWYYEGCVYLGIIQAAQMIVNGKIYKQANNKQMED